MKRLLIILVLHHGSALYDAWTTQRLVSSGGRELNPAIRSFAKSPSIYLVVQGDVLIADFLCIRRSKFCKVASSLVTSEHLAFGLRNQFGVIPKQNSINAAYEKADQLRNGSTR